MHDISRSPLEVYSTLWPEGIGPTVTISTWPLITHMGPFAEKYDRGVEIAIPAQQALPAHLVDAKAKTRSRMHYKLAELQGKRIGENIWPVMLDPDGFLAEGPGWNIFLVNDGVIYSPEPRNILLGVSRGTVLDLAAQEKIEVREQNLGRYEALQADEIFCSSTSYGIVHAATFEGQPVDSTSSPRLAITPTACPGGWNENGKRTVLPWRRPRPGRVSLRARPYSRIGSICFHGGGTISSIRAKCSAGIVTSRAATASATWSIRLAPMTSEVIAGRVSAQANA